MIGSGLPNQSRVKHKSHHEHKTHIQEHINLQLDDGKYKTREKIANLKTKFP